MTDPRISENFTATMEKFLTLACTRLPDDVYEKLKELRENESSDIQKVLYDAYFENLRQAVELGRPCCQDTGLLHFYIKAGTSFPYLDMVASALGEAVRRATRSVPLRQNTVNYFEERNTGDNTGERMPWINWDLVPGGGELEIITYFAGGGCCLPGRSRVFKPSDGYAAIVQSVFDAVADLGINACPPLIVGVGLGHNVENAAMLSKKAYLRPLGSSHPHPRGAEMERQLTGGLNKLGIGAQGMRGNSAVMGVHIESSARHTATIAVAVNTACYAHRRGLIKFKKDMSCELVGYKGVVL
ncbi:MAG: L(+)-tartrate dehydratase subunit alpha [Treponema sp.]|jgi:L(+)-tartrate dehydratase alpha subunit|nr:L(+)-tartrate dehydratase subunit alpha [Treponema sp.]